MCGVCSVVSCGGQCVRNVAQSCIPLYVFSQCICAVLGWLSCAPILSKATQIELIVHPSSSLVTVHLCRAWRAHLVEGAELIVQRDACIPHCAPILSKSHIARAACVCPARSFVWHAQRADSFDAELRPGCSCFQSFSGAGCELASGRPPAAAMEADDPLGQSARRGGMHQRHQRAQRMAYRAAAEAGGDAAQAARSPVGHLAHTLLQMWAWGDLSATKVQILAGAACKDSCAEPSLQGLAKLGAAGAQPGNCHRDLLEFLRRLGLPQRPCAVSVPTPLQLRTRPIAELVDLPYMPLHRLMGHMHEHWPAEWRRAVVGCADEAEAWWRCIDKAGDPRWAAWKSALLQRALDTGVSLRELLAKAIPLALHADGVRVFRRKSLMVLSAVSLLGKGSTRDLKLLLQCYWTQLACKGDSAEADTEKAVWQAVHWDLEACFAGTHPAQDYKGAPWPPGSAEAGLAGKPWGGGCIALPWICRGDLDQFAKGWGLESYTSNTPCPWCKADRSTMPWTDFKESALWQATCWNTDAAWRQAHPVRHPMFNCLCMGIHSAVVDGPLHTIALGVAQHCTGNVLVQLLYDDDAMPVCLGTVAEKLSIVWDIVQ